MSGFVALIDGLPERFAQRALLIDAQGALMADAARAQILELAGLWSRSGARTIASALDNGRQALLVDLSIQYAGRTQLALPPYFSAAQREHALEDAGADTLLLPVGQPPPAGWVAGEACSAIADCAVWRRRRDASCLPQGTACVTYTSGSTGTPRGICLDAASLLRTAAALQQAFADLPIAAHLCMLPLSTLLEAVGCYAALSRGATLHLPGLAMLGYSGAAGMDASRLFATWRAARADSLILVPQLLTVLVHLLERHPECALRPQLVAVGGAKVPSGLLQRAEALGLPVFEGYGLSEAGSVVALNRPGALRAGSVGRVLPHFQLRFAADGEIWLRGQSPLRRAGDPPCCDADGWWPTGDLGRVDQDGFLHLSGRKRNCFITAYGRNVSPEWIEAELQALPGVVQAVVDGEGQPVNLAVVSGSHAAFDAGDGAAALDALNRRLPDYARVASLVWSDRPWTVLNGLATGNGRARRDVVLAQHAAQLTDCRFQLSENTEQGVHA